MMDGIDQTQRLVLDGAGRGRVMKATGLGLAASLLAHAAVIAAMTTSSIFTTSRIESEEAAIQVDLIELPPEAEIAPDPTTQPQQEAPAESALAEEGEPVEAAPPEAEPEIPKQAATEPKPVIHADVTEAVEEVEDSSDGQDQTPADQLVSFTGTALDLAAAHAQQSDGYGPDRVSLREWMRGQVSSCWHFDERILGDRAVTVDLLLELDSSGNLRGSARTLGISAGSLRDDAQLRLFVESARQAVRNCAPFSGLPRERYAEWRTVRITFVSS